MRVAITGASGFLGGHVRSKLEQSGHSVLSIGRGSGTDIRWDPSAGQLDSDGLSGVDAVIHLAGESIGGDRFLGRQWNDAKKHAILQSRIDGTGLVARTIAEMDRPPSVLLSASAHGYYGDRGEELLTEESDAGDNFFAEVCQAWEGATQPAVEAGIRVVTTRTGIVVKEQSEAFRRLLIPARLGAGALGSGRQWWDVISLTDTVRAFVRIIEDDGLVGPFNLVSPEPMRQKDFAKALGRRIGRPSVVPAPEFGLKALLGSEFVENVLMPSLKVVPKRLLDHGFEFAHPSVDSILAAEIG